jgi:hypothetical protein
MNAFGDTLIQVALGLGWAYFIVAGGMLFIEGLVWITLREHIESRAARRLLSSMGLALAFTPGLLPVHANCITIPAFPLLLVGFAVLTVSARLYYGLSIIVVWGAVFGVRVLALKFQRKHEGV